jgi:hypothetical protein
MKTLDKKLYQEAYEHYRQWNEAEFINRVRNAGKMSPLDAFQQYISLVEFCWKLCPEQSEIQRERKLATIDRYYERIKKLEAWRKKTWKSAWKLHYA